MGLLRRGREREPEQARCSICGTLHPVATMVTRHKDAEDIPEDALSAFAVPRDWWLEDAEAQHADHPRSFFIPSDARRRRLRAGELVRLGSVERPHVAASRRFRSGTVCGGRLV